MIQPDDDSVINQAVLNALLEEVAPLVPPAGLKARVMAHVSTQDSAFVTVRGGDGWRNLLPGVDYKMLLFDTLTGNKSFLMRAAAGTHMPAHGHHGNEECVVLTGEFIFDNVTLRAGDFHMAMKEAQHSEAYTEKGVTVYIRAPIEDYPGVNP